MLTINNVNKYFGEKAVLKGTNFDVEDGSIFGLVGINGAGKSTLLRCIAGVYQCDGGSIELNGINTFEDTSFRREIIFIPDDPYLSPSGNIESQIIYYQSFYHFDIDVANAYIDRLKLNRKQQFSTYSKGMKRQVCLIFAIASKPKLLMLDEMFDGLDPLVRLIFKKGLITLVDENNTSIIISSHNLKELEDICDSFGILEDGAVSTYGDLIETKEKVNKYQVAFNEEKTREDFDGLDILHFSSTGRVITLVVRGEQQAVSARLMSMNPILLDEIPVNFEELFIYEMEARGDYYE